MKEKKYMISIIIPCYNSFSKMGKCLEALEKQEFKDFEVIIVDDSSTDNSFEKLNEYINKTKLNIKLIKNEKNYGAGETRNIGIHNSIGDYIMFIDSDDYISHDCLKLLNNIISMEKEIDCICFDYFKVEDKNNKYRTAIINRINKSGFLNTDEVLRNVKGCTCGKLYLSKNIKKNNIKFASLIRNEDMPFTKVAISYCRKIYYYNDIPLYYYVMNNDSLMHQEKLLDEKNAIYAFEIVKDKLNVELKKELESIFISECLYSIICTTITKGYTKKQIKAILDNQIICYKNWFKNDTIKEMDFYKKIILLFYKINFFTPIRIIMAMKRWFYV